MRCVTRDDHTGVFDAAKSTKERFLNKIKGSVHGKRFWLLTHFALMLSFIHRKHQISWVAHADLGRLKKKRSRIEANHMKVILYELIINLLVYCILMTYYCVLS